jgi:hypothetical protein
MHLTLIAAKVGSLEQRYSNTLKCVKLVPLNRQRAQHFAARVPNLGHI